MKELVRNGRVAPTTFGAVGIAGSPTGEHEGKRRRFTADVLAILAILAASLLLTWRTLLRHEVMYPADIVQLYEPWQPPSVSADAQNHYLSDVVRAFNPERQFAAAELRNGRLPLWNPRMGLGYPVLAGQESIWTWSLPLYVAFEYWTARALELYGTLVLAAVLAYAFLRHLGLRTISALLGAFVASLGYQFVQHLLTGHLVQPLLLIPAVLYSLDRWRSARSARWLVGAAVLLGGAYLAASLQGMVYATLLVGLDMLWFAWKRARSLGVRPGVRHLLAEAIPVIGIALIVAALRILPTLELLKHNERAIGRPLSAWAEATGRRLLGLPVIAVGAVAPGLLGDHRSIDLTKALGDFGIRATITGQEFKPYIGIIALVLAMFAVRSRTHRPIIERFLFLLLAPLVLALISPLTLLLYYPRVLAVSPLPLAVLSAVGLEVALREESRPRLAVWARRLAIAVACGLLFGSAASIFVATHRTTLALRVRAQVERRLIDSDHPGPREYQLAKADRLVDSLAFPSRAVLLPLFFGGLVAAGLAGLGRISRQRASLTLAGALVAASVADMTLLDAAFLPLLPRSAAERELPVFGFLRREPAGTRITTLGASRSERLFLPANIPSAHGIDDARVYESLVPSPALPRGDSLGRLSAVTHVVTPITDTLAGARLVYQGEVRVFRTYGSVPRTYAVYDVVGVSTSAEVPTALRAGGFDPLHTVVRVGPTHSAARDCEAPSLTSLDRTPTEIHVRADLACDGVVVRVDRAYPGWRVWMDGRPASLAVANNGLLAVAAGQGVHDITFQYSPASVKAGLLLTGASLVVGLACILFPVNWGSWRQKRR